MHIKYNHQQALFISNLLVMTYFYKIVIYVNRSAERYTWKWVEKRRRYSEFIKNNFVN